MGTKTTIALSATGGIGGFLIFAAQTKREDAMSNLSTWIPLLESVKSADTIATIVGCALVTSAVGLAIMKWMKSNKHNAGLLNRDQALDLTLPRLHKLHFYAIGATGIAPNDTQALRICYAQYLEREGVSYPIQADDLDALLNRLERAHPNPQSGTGIHMDNVGHAKITNADISMETGIAAHNVGKFNVDRVKIRKPKGEA